MILTGSKIESECKANRIHISDFNKDRINPNSYNLRLHNELYVYKDNIIDSKKKPEVEKIKIPESGLLLEPNKLYLGRTIESTHTDIYVPMLEGRSSIGRLGIFIHTTAGFGDIGFNGTWTLEISCVQPVIVYPNMEICQVYFMQYFGKNDIKYNGKYNNQKDIGISKMYDEIEAL